MQLTLDNNTITNAKPFLKWVGGKRQLIPEIEKNIPTEIKEKRTINKYFEPFIGGGAVLFYLLNNYNVKNAYISDVNKELILAYNIIKNKSKSLIEELYKLQDEYIPLNEEERKKYYYNIRENFNNNLEKIDYDKNNEENIIRTSQIIFMNKTGFNGLYRVNKKGEYNVPPGKYKNPLICDKDNIKNVHNCLKNVEIHNKTYSFSENFIDNKSFVYLDPPYRPLNQTSNFTNYSNIGFNDNDQIQLSEYYKRISDKGAYAMLSNSDPHNNDINDDFFDNLYSEFNIHRVKAKRSVNSNSKKRGSINELLITNY